MHVFAHNGDLRNIQSQHQLELGRFRPIGDTDSEYAFCVLLHRLETKWLPGTSVPSLQERVQLFREFVEPLRDLGPANIVYSDGDAVFIHGHKRKPKPTAGVPRPPGLHVLCRRCAAPLEKLAMEGVCVEPGPVDQEVVLAASIPLTRENWRPLAEGEILVLDQGRILDGTALLRSD